MLYLDANIFIYASDASSRYHRACKELLDLVAEDRIQAVTSAETIQEIVHYFRRNGRTGEALYACDRIFKIVQLLTPLDLEVLQTYLRLVEKYDGYKKIESRDLLHLATCVETRTFTILSYDKDLEIFEEVAIKKPEEIAGEVN